MGTSAYQSNVKKGQAPQPQQRTLCTVSGKKGGFWKSLLEKDQPSAKPSPEARVSYAPLGTETAGAFGELLASASKKARRGGALFLEQNAIHLTQDDLFGVFKAAAETRNNECVATVARILESQPLETQIGIFGKTMKTDGISLARFAVLKWVPRLLEHGIGFDPKEHLFEIFRAVFVFGKNDDIARARRMLESRTLKEQRDVIERTVNDGGPAGAKIVALELAKRLPKKHIPGIVEEAAKEGDLEVLFAAAELVFYAPDSKVKKLAHLTGWYKSYELHEKVSSGAHTLAKMSRGKCLVLLLKGSNLDLYVESIRAYESLPPDSRPPISGIGAKDIVKTLWGPQGGWLRAFLIYPHLAEETREETKDLVHCRLRQFIFEQDMMFNLRSPGFAMHNFSIGDLIERMPEGIRNELWDCEARVVGGNLMRYRLAPVLVEKISQLPLKYRKQMYGIAKENAKGFMKDPKSVIFKVRADDIARIIAALPEEWRHPLASLSVTVPEKGKEMMMEKIEMRMPGIFSGNPPNPRWDF